MTLFLLFILFLMFDSKILCYFFCLQTFLSGYTKIFQEFSKIFLSINLTVDYYSIINKYFSTLFLTLVLGETQIRIFQNIIQTINFINTSPIAFLSIREMQKRTASFETKLKCLKIAHLCSFKALLTYYTVLMLTS
jgi:hypothetical protein